MMGKNRIIRQDQQQKVSRKKISHSQIVLQQLRKVLNCWLLATLAANSDFKVVSIDIRAAFLQANKLDREVFVRPPDDIKKEGKIQKLLKPLYRLDDASRIFYLKIKKTLKELGLKTLPGDDAFYYENKDGNLLGINLSHVDDFTIAGNEEFVRRIVKGISDRFT